MKVSDRMWWRRCVDDVTDAVEFGDIFEDLKVSIRKVDDSVEGGRSL